MTVKEAIGDIDIENIPPGTRRAINYHLDDPVDRVSPSLIRFISRLRVDAGKSRIGK